MAGHERTRTGIGTRMGALALTALAALLVVPTAAHAADPSADLSVTLDHSPGAPIAQTDVTITLHVRNDGPDTAVGAVAAFGELSYRFQTVDAPSGCSRSGETGSVICPLGDLASGTTTDVVVTVRPRGSGLYPVTAAAASSTPDPDSADRTATDSIIVQKGVSQAERYLTAIYPITLDRPLDAASLAYWGPRWQQTYRVYPQNHEVVPAALLRSAEHRRTVVREAFTRILGRNVDPGGLTYWVNKLGTGVRTEQVERSLFLSNEFVRKHKTNEKASLPTAVWRAVIGTEPTSAQVAPLIEELYVGKGYVAMVTRIQRSTEAYDVLIKAAHQDAFGTAPLAIERYNWQVGLRNGETRESMLADLLSSWKFLDDFPLTEDDYPYIEEFARTPSDPAAVLAEADGAARAG